MPDNLPTTHTVELNNATFEWDLTQGSLNFFGLPAALFWLNPSLYTMLEPLAAEVGIPLFRLLVAHSASQGTAEDYHAMVTVLGNNFQEGFLAWGKAVSTAGWGQFSLSDYDSITKSARVTVHNAWELVMQRGTTNTWGCPFLQGKIIGIFSHAFGTSCWADEHIHTTESGLAVEFRIYAEQKTIQAELAALRLQQQSVADEQLQREIERKAQEIKAMELRLREDVIAAQDAALRELATPLIPIAKGVIAMPLVGTITTDRAQQIVEILLQGCTNSQARIALVDITGVKVVDTHVANALVQAANAARLLGVHVVLTGISPEVAQTLVGLGTPLAGITTKSTLQSGIAFALNYTA